jgi:hypothetical protein
MLDTNVTNSFQQQDALEARLQGLGFAGNEGRFSFPEYLI